MITRTLQAYTNDAIKVINEYEDGGWAVRQIIPLLDSEAFGSYSKSFTAEVLIVFESEEV